jgi:hypothetical protein
MSCVEQHQGNLDRPRRRAPFSTKIELSYASSNSQPNFNGNLWKRGRPISQLFDAGKDDPIVSWRWRVWISHKMQEGSARTETKAREVVRDCWLNIIHPGRCADRIFFN